MNKYFSAILLAALSNIAVQAQSLQPAPRLVVAITIDQLRTDCIEQFMPLYTPNGFKRLLQNGMVYESATYPFTPVDRSSAIATIFTGTIPNYHNIVGAQWLDRNTLQPVSCTDDDKYQTSPQELATSTVGDEIKISSQGSAIVYGIAIDKDAAVLSAGHAADGAYWFNDKKHNWTTSKYYNAESQKWITSYNSIHPHKSENEDIADLAIDCVNNHAMGRDDIPDLLAVTLSAKDGNLSNWQTDMETVYRSLDQTLANIITHIEDNVGVNHVIFVITGTGYTEEPVIDYQKYRIPTGTFYINRSGNLLNMYLSAIYGQGKYVETYFHNQIYFDRKLLEQKRIDISEVLSRSRDFLIQNAGVSNARISPYSPNVSGDIIIDVTPGWQLLNENTQEKYISRVSYVPFPIIFYGAGTKAEHIKDLVTVDRIAPTLSKSIHIRAPNACSAVPLF